MNDKIDNQLQNILDWTNQKLATGEEPPWSWYQFMKLREAIEAIRTGSLYIPIEEDSQESVERQETGHQPKGCIVPINSARRHPDNADPQQPR